jgi:pimeloyl-ACP methyl ester carboxylesterase
MEFSNRWANSEGVKVHYLESEDYDNQLTPLVYVPGALNYAEQSVELMQEFKQRKTISMSLRGRGKSDAPVTGYSFIDHVKDIDAVILHSQVKEYCLMAYSMGVPYAIKHAVNSPYLKGIIICDYPAKYPSIPESWTERVLNLSYIKKEKKHVVEGIQKASTKMELYSELKLIGVPVLIIKGGTTKGSLLSDIETEQYKINLQDVFVVELGESGHELWKPNREEFLHIIKDFLYKLDSSY